MWNILLNLRASRWRYLAAVLQVIAAPKFSEANIRYVRPIPTPAGALDTRLPPSEIDSFLYRQVFETLVTFGKHGELNGGIAKSWNVAPDGRTVRFQLHPDVRFHSGVGLTSKDVKYSLERLIRAESYAGGRLREVASISTSGPYSLEIQLKKSNPRFIYQLGDPNHAILQYGENSATLNGTGPFVLRSKTPDNIILGRNPHYTRKSVGLDEMEIKVMKLQDAKSAYLEGKADDLFHYNLNAVDRSQLGDKCVWHNELLPAFRFLVLKADSHPALKSIDDRTCMASVLNRGQIAKKLMPGSPLLTSILPRGIFGGEQLPLYTDPKLCDEKSLERIRQITKKNPLGLLEYVAAPEGSNSIRESLEAAGIGVAMKSTGSLDEFFSTMNAAFVHIYTARFIPRTPESEVFLQAFASPKPFFPIGRLSAKLKREIAAISSIENPQQRFKAVGDVFRTIGNNFVLIPLFQFEFNGCVSRKWKGVEIPPVGFIDQPMHAISPVL